MFPTTLSFSQNFTLENMFILRNLLLITFKLLGKSFELGGTLRNFFHNFWSTAKLFKIPQLIFFKTDGVITSEIVPYLRVNCP